MSINVHSQWMERVSLGRIQNPIRGILHGTAAIVSIGALAALANAGVSPSIKVALMVYGVSLVALYTVSCLYHSVPWSDRWKARWQRLDHTLIFVLVAGTCTPLLVGVLDGAWVLTGLLLIWGLAAVGAVREFFPATRNRWSLTVQMVLGAAALVPVVLMLGRMEPWPLTLTVIGGVVYLGGLALFVNGRPVLFPRIFSHHEVFHILVVVASISHFAAVWQIVTGPALAFA